MLNLEYETDHQLLSRVREYTQDWDHDWVLESTENGEWYLRAHFGSLSEIVQNFHVVLLRVSEGGALVMGTARLGRGRDAFVKAGTLDDLQALQDSPNLPLTAPAAFVVWKVATEACLKLSDDIEIRYVGPDRGEREHPDVWYGFRSFDPLWQTCMEKYVWPQLYGEIGRIRNRFIKRKGIEGYYSYQIAPPGSTLWEPRIEIDLPHPHYSDREPELKLNVQNFDCTTQQARAYADELRKASDYVDLMRRIWPDVREMWANLHRDEFGT